MQTIATSVPCTGKTLKTKKSKECVIRFEENDGEDGGMDVEIRIAKKHAEAMTKAFWKNYAKGINAKGFRNGKVPLSMAKSLKIPIESMMQTTYSQYANIKFVEAIDGKVILTTDHEVKGSIVKFKAWLEPKVFLTKEDLEGVLGQLFKIPKFDNALYMEDRLYAFKKLHPYLRNKEGMQGEALPAVDGDMVEIKVDCTIDGQPYKDGCEEATRIRLIKDTIKPVSLYERLLGVMPGQEIMLETNDVPRQWGSKIAGKTMRLFIKILRIYSCEESQVDDDLAITAGYNSLDEWKKALGDSAARIALGQYDIHKKQLILAAILGVARIGDFPEKWLDEKVKELEHLKDPDIRTKVHEVAKHTTILKKVGELLGVKWVDEDKVNVMRDEAAYAQQVFSELLSRMKYEYVDTVSPEIIKRDSTITTQTPTP